MEHPEPVLAIAPIGLLALSVGLSLLAGYLLKAKDPSPVQDERPTPLSSRGSYCAWFMGVRRLGYVTTWAGDRKTKRIDIGKGSFFTTKGDPKTYKESAMHVIAVGDCNSLEQIEQGGKIIFEGPINPLTHPSGSTVDLGGEGSFRIFWGEDDQPVNTYLGDPSRVGVSSRWPNFCYIEWRDKRLGSSPNWPFISYVMSRRPSGSYLSGSDPWTEPTYTLDGQVFDDFESVDTVASTITLSSLSGPGKGDFTSILRPGDLVRLTGALIPDQDLNVLSVTPETVFPSGVPEFQSVVEFAEDLTGLTTQGEFQLYSSANDDGANPAHLVADVLFEKWPQGASMDTDDWDLDSLEDMATAEVEIRASSLSQDAGSVQELVGSMLQDMGYMLPIDPTSGLLRFVALRDTTGETLPHLPSRIQTRAKPELEKTIGQRPSDSLLFRFQDREINFRDMTIGRMEDGQISRLEVARARTIDIPNTVHYETAATVANRRTQEEMANAAIWSVLTNRKTREWYPGLAITADFTSEVLRIIEVQATPDSNQVTLKVMVDSYGVEASDFEDTQPPIPPGAKAAQQDLLFDLVEASEYLPLVPPQTALVPRVRAHAEVEGSIIHLSADDVTYVEVDETDVYNPGGALLEALPSTGLFEVEGTQFSIYGPDISEVLDLSADDTNWRLGRQLCVIVSSAGTEICFAKGVTIVSGETYQIDGLIRARYETRRLDHPIGSRVYFIDNTQLERITDPLLAPEVTRYAKSQPFGAGTVDLSIVAPASRLLYGKGVRPPAVSALAVVEPKLNNIYQTGDDVKVTWNYATPQTPGTSAGLQDAGTPVGSTAPEGEFLLEVKTTGDVVVHTENLTSPEFLYTNANLIADLGGEVDFKVSVTQMRNGYLSTPETITIEAL